MGDLMLKEFATGISTAIAGGVNPKWFDSGVGLCTNLSNYMDYKELSYRYERVRLREQMNSIINLYRRYDFEQYPFNSSALDYCNDIENDVVYKNHYRLVCIEEMKNT